MEKVLSITLKKTNLNKALLQYLAERKEDPVQFGAVSGYLKSLLDQIKEKDVRDNVSKAISHYINSHFWAGILFAKSNPNSVEINYLTQKEIQAGNKREKESYLG